MKFHSFEELKRIHGIRTDKGIVRFTVSLIAATLILSGLVMLIPLGT